MNEYITYRLASILCRMVPEKLAYWFGLRLSDLFYVRNHVGREAIISNLKRIYTARGVVPEPGSLMRPRGAHWRAPHLRGGVATGISRPSSS